MQTQVKFLLYCYIVQNTNSKQNQISRELKTKARARKNSCNFIAQAIVFCICDATVEDL